MGEQGVVTVLHGSTMRRFASRYRDEQNTHGELITQINAPVESLLIDVIVHRDLREQMQLESGIYQGRQEARSQRLGT